MIANSRLRDVVRQARYTLLAAGCITEQEFTELAHEEVAIEEAEARGGTRKTTTGDERQRVLDEVLNVVSYFFDSHKGMINTNVACEVLLGRINALKEKP